MAIWNVLWIFLLDMPYQKWKIEIKKRAKVYRPNVHSMDRITVIWIWIFHRFHKRVLINKKILLFKYFIYIRLTLSNMSNSSIYFSLSYSWMIAIEIFVNNLKDQFRYILLILCFFGFGFFLFDRAYGTGPEKIYVCRSDLSCVNYRYEFKIGRPQTGEVLDTKSHWRPEFKLYAASDLSIFLSTIAVVQGWILTRLNTYQWCHIHPMSLCLDS